MNSSKGNIIMSYVAVVIDVGLVVGDEGDGRRRGGCRRWFGGL